MADSVKGIEDREAGSLHLAKGQIEPKSEKVEENNLRRKNNLEKIFRNIKDFPHCPWAKMLLSSRTGLIISHHHRINDLEVKASSKKRKRKSDYNGS